jgi:hypothetical protein
MGRKTEKLLVDVHQPIWNNMHCKAAKFSLRTFKTSTVSQSVSMPGEYILQGVDYKVLHNPIGLS